MDYFITVWVHACLRVLDGNNIIHYTANPRITRLIRSEKSSRNTKTRKVNNW